MTEESEDARMRALFGEAMRPPMGDEAFVAAVMGRVEEVRASEKVRRQVMALGGVAVAGAVLWPFKAPIEAALLSAGRFVPDLPALSGSASALLIAAAVSLAAWAYAERG